MRTVLVHAWEYVAGDEPSGGGFDSGSGVKQRAWVSDEEGN